ncbi:hypothetical protein [Hylemonella gracilis]|uniref:hypothetical protein n=1 Tax=Hylemonella gracilis TaxID=80880 RepID=UPI001F622BA6|nr:hypothetical protein [Hylemonella gracilis]
MYWIGGYIVFVGLNVVGVELSFKVTLVVTLLALACLVGFWFSAIPNMDFTRWALNIGVGADGAPVELAGGGGSFLPFGFHARWRPCRSRCALPGHRAVAPGGRRIG